MSRTSSKHDALAVGSRWLLIRRAEADIRAPRYNRHRPRTNSCFAFTKTSGTADFLRKLSKKTVAKLRVSGSLSISFQVVIRALKPSRSAQCGSQTRDRVSPFPPPHLLTTTDLDRFDSEPCTQLALSIRQMIGFERTYSDCGAGSSIIGPSPEAPKHRVRGAVFGAIMGRFYSAKPRVISISFHLRLCSHCISVSQRRIPDAGISAKKRSYRSLLPSFFKAANMPVAHR